MKTTHLLLAILLASALPGCASSTHEGPHLSGDTTARMGKVWSDEDTGIAIVPVEHRFELTNTGTEPVVIVSHRTRIETTWRFADTGDGRLPRTIAPGETVPVLVTAKVKGPGEQRYFVELHQETGAVTELEVLVGG